jgi:hypothetical protein
MKTFAQIILLVLLLSTIVMAQDTTSSSDVPAVSEGQVSAASAAIDSLGSVSFSELTQKNCSTSWMGQEAQQACKEAWKGFFQYARDGYVHRKNVFQKQYWLSYGIFFVAVALVFLGMYFAWVQFSLSMQSRAKAESGAVMDDLKTELSMSKSEIKVNSPVLGVIILIISLAFFYMYLVFVFPVQDTF